MTLARAAVATSNLGIPHSIKTIKTPITLLWVWLPRRLSTLPISMARVQNLLNHLSRDRGNLSLALNIPMISSLNN